MLALCVPAGYALRWATTSDDDDKHRTRRIRSPDGFAKYVIAARAQVSPTLAILTLEPRDRGSELEFAPLSPGSSLEEEERAVLSVEIKQPMLQVARAYTLLPPEPPSNLSRSSIRESGDSGDGIEEEGGKTYSSLGRPLRVLLRRQPTGEVSRYVHDLAVGAEVEIRGPQVEAVLPEEGLEEVVFLAAGTGIAPALRVAQILARIDVSVKVLWASRRREDCVGGESDGRKWTQLLWSWLWSRSRAAARVGNAAVGDAAERGHVVRELEWHKENRKDGGLHLSYYVDEEGSFIRPHDVAALIDAGNNNNASSGGRRMLFVSGPDGFVSYWAGEARQWEGGREVQGRIVGGELARMDLEGGRWSVVKMS